MMGRHFEWMEGKDLDLQQDPFLSSWPYMGNWRKCYMNSVYIILC